MGGDKSIAVILLSTILLTISVTLSSCDPTRRLSSEILDSYRSFSYAVLRDKYTRKVEDIGTAGYSTLGLGQLLAVVNEQLWPVDTYGFDSALKVPKSKIFETYKQMLESLTKDPDVTMYSDIYTSRHDYKGPPSLEDLKTKITYVDYNTTNVNVNSVVAEINARIVIQTFAKIYESLVPQGGWWGLPFFNYTQGVLTNTFHFKANLANALRATVEQPFYDSPENITFFETTALPISGPKDKYVAVRIPFKLSSKSLVLILPKGNVTTFVKNDLEAHLRKVNTDTRVEKTVTIRIPSMEFSNIPNSYFRQLKKLGVTESFCRYDVQKKNVLESISQNIYMSLTPDFLFQVAAATGSHINNVENFLNIHNSDLEPQIQEDDGVIMGDAETNKETLARLKSDLFLDGEMMQRDLAVKNKKYTKTKNKDTEQSIKNKDSQKSSSEHVETGGSDEDDSTDSPMVGDKGRIINFNRPFFYYVDDDDFGPIFYGSVTSFHQYKKHEQDVPPPGQEWQQEGMKYLFWSCP